MRAITLGPIVCAAAGLVLAAGHASAQHAVGVGSPGDRAAIQAELWANELAIYAGRGRGDVSPYLNNVASDYAGWPPGAKSPIDASALKAGAVDFANSKEKLDLSFVDLRLSGDTAVLYYRTHQTVLPNGTPVNLYFQVTHTWVRENGRWHILGGMARPASAP